MTLDSVVNFSLLTLSQGYGASDTTIVLASGGSSLPSAPFNATWWDSTDYPNPVNDPNVEIVRVTNVNGNILTIQRGAESATGGGSASTKNNAGKTYSFMLGITAKMITDIGANLQQPWKLVTVSGTINGINTVFTLNGSISPYDANSLQLSLARQPQIQGIDYTLSGVTITYTTPPDKSLAGQPHYAQYQ
jgi:hypothetical protein